MMLEDVLTDFASFLYDDRVGFVNDITFIIHNEDGSQGKEVTCKAPSAE